LHGGKKKKRKKMKATNLLKNASEVMAKRDTPLKFNVLRGATAII